MSEIKEETISLIREKACKMRKLIIEMLAEAGSGHPGGSLSAADIISALYFYKMNYDVKKPDWVERDRFILSKGHAAPVLYAALIEAGFIAEEHKLTLRKMDSLLQGHPDMHKVPGVEVSTGSLGQGLSVAVGMALANKMDNRSSTVYCMIGDGESQEGQIWEAAMSAAHHKLDNLVVILDRNHLQIDGNTEDVKALGPVADKWRSFGFEVDVIDGHDYVQIIEALDRADNIKGKPVLILAETVKGKGVSFMEHRVNFHGVAPSKDEGRQALEELGHS